MDTMTMQRPTLVVAGARRVSDSVVPTRPSAPVPSMRWREPSDDLAVLGCDARRGRTDCSLVVSHSVVGHLPTFAITTGAKRVAPNGHLSRHLGTRST